MESICGQNAIADRQLGDAGYRKLLREIASSTLPFGPLAPSRWCPCGVPIAKRYKDEEGDV